jgi:hypothetical protein
LTIALFSVEAGGEFEFPNLPIVIKPYIKISRMVEATPSPAF